MESILGGEDILGVDDILGMVESGDLTGEEAAAILGVDDEAILGQEDLMGMESILGGPIKTRGRAGKKLLAKSIAARKLGSAQILAPRAPSSSGVQAIGFLQAGVLPGAAAIATTQPQTWFKPMRLVVPESIAAFFTIDNIIVGNKSQFPSPVPLPAETFIPPAESVVMDLDTVNPALNLTVVATNISGIAQTFRATFVGKQVTP